MTFEQDYINLLGFAKEQLKINRVGVNLSPVDLVHDAYLKIIDSGQPYSSVTIRSNIISLGYKEQNRQIAHEKIDETKKYLVKETNQYCKSCKEVKPLLGFKMVMVGALTKPHHICRDCEKEKFKEYYNKNKARILRSSKVYKEKNKEKIKWYRIKYNLINGIKPRIKLTDEERRIKHNARMKEVMKRRYHRLNGNKPKKEARPIKELWREANKRYQQKQKENLTDTYIKSILANKYKSTKDIPQKAINKKRAELIDKRKMVA